MTGTTKIVLDLQSDKILNSPTINNPEGLVKADIEGLVLDLSALTTADESLETKITTDIDAANESIDLRVSSVETNLTNEISSTNDDVDSIDSRVSSVETNLTTEKERIDAILDASDADKDSFREIVSLINAVDAENDSDVASVILNLNSEISSTNDDVDSIDLRVSSVETNLTNEISSTNEDVTRLQENIDAEESARVLADNQVADYVDAARPRIVNSYTGNGLQTSYSSGVVEATIMVFLNGLMQREEDDYTINLTSGNIEFGSAPTTGSKIDLYGVPDSATKPEFE